MDLGSSRSSLYDPVSVKWFGFVSLDDVQTTDKQYFLRLAVGRTQFGKLSLKNSELLDELGLGFYRRSNKTPRSLPSKSSSHGRYSLPSHVTRIRRPHHKIANLLARFDSGLTR